MNLACGRLELGHGAAALAESERAAEVARSLDVKARALTLANLASVHLHLQNYRRSIEYSRQAVEVSQAAANRLWEGNSLLNIGAAYWQLGENDASRAAYEAALKVLETTKDRIGGSRVVQHMGVIAADEERFEAAAAYLERALPVIRSADIRHSHQIELEPDRYRNPIEVAALQVLVEAYAARSPGGRGGTHGGAPQADQADGRSPQALTALDPPSPPPAQGTSRSSPGRVRRRRTVRA